jgi:hypothetical protein
MQTFTPSTDTVRSTFRFFMAFALNSYCKDNYKLMLEIFRQILSRNSHRGQGVECPTLDLKIANHIPLGIYSVLQFPQSLLDTSSGFKAGRKLNIFKESINKWCLSFSYLDDLIWLLTNISMTFNLLLHIHLHRFGNQCKARSASTSVPSDQDLHCLILIHNVISDQEANSVDPDQTAQMCLLI